METLKAGVEGSRGRGFKCYVGARRCLAQRMLVIYFVLSLIATPGFCGEKAAGWKFISPEKVYSLMKEGSGLWLVDVRGELSFNQEHIEGAINIPVSSIETKQLPKNKIIVLVDDSLGQKAAREAAEIASKKGYQKLFVMSRGVAGWRTEGYPTVGGMGIVPLSKAVTKEELRWAIDSGIPVKIYDMRDSEAVKAGSMSGARTVEGNDLAARIDNLKKLLKKPTPLTSPSNKGGKLKGDDLSKRLEGPPTVVLVFSANDDSQSLADKAAFGAYGDVRYLQGGYETWAVKTEDRVKISGGCPTCPKSQK